MTKLEPERSPAEDTALDHRRRHAARVFLIALLFMLVVSAIVFYVLLQYRHA